MFFIQVLQVDFLADFQFTQVYTGLLFLPPDVFQELLLLRNQSNLRLRPKHPIPMTKHPNPPQTRARSPVPSARNGMSLSLQHEAAHACTQASQPPPPFQDNMAQIVSRKLPRPPRPPRPSSIRHVK